MSRYSQLCPVYFGPGEINNTGAIAKELGMTNVLLVTEKKQLQRQEFLGESWTAFCRAELK
ncbi:hypothetical protein [Lacrimispora xylanisolvens]|uniref:hypothetical protein n=1 Tax=Lacrimispora xylanisolvens TaxID=384636 RepID=UPI0024029D40